MQTNFERFCYHIFYSLKKFDGRLSLVDPDDALQEIRYSMLIADNNHVFKVAHHFVDQLIRDYGFSRKKGKDNFEVFYEQPVFTEEEQELLNSIEQIYLDANHTAREVAQILDIEYNNQLQKLLHTCFPKNLGWGGARKNAGNKHLLN